MFLHKKYIYCHLQSSWNPWNQGRRRGSCSVLSLRNYHTGIIRCLGDGGYNVFKEFIVPVRVDRQPWNQKRNTTTCIKNKFKISLFFSPV